MTNILVTGANGQLGSELQQLATAHSDLHFFFTDVPALDITDEVGLDHFVTTNHISAMVNCAAYTNVDKAETDLDLAHKINALGPAVMAKVAAKHDIILIHISTDYVFDGTAHIPYSENDPTCPMGAYGKTKRDGELAVIESGCKGIIIRTSWLYSSFGNNFVKTMLRLGAEREELRVIFDQVGTPTYAADLAKAIVTIIPQLETTPQHGAIYHFSDEGVCSWYDFSTAILKISGTNCRVLPIESKDYPTAAKRPHYSVLNKAKIRADFGIEIPHWKESLIRCLAILQ